MIELHIIFVDSFNHHFLTRSLCKLETSMAEENAALAGAQ